MLIHTLKINSELQNTCQKIFNSLFLSCFFCLLGRIIKMLFKKENHLIVLQYIDWQIRINDLPCFSLLFAVITSRCYQNQRSIYLESVLLLCLYVLVLGAENSQTPDFLIRVRGAAAAAEQGGWCVSVILQKSCKEAFLWKNYEIWADFWPDDNTEKKIGGQL